MGADDVASKSTTVVATEHVRISSIISISGILITLHLNALRHYVTFFLSTDSITSDIIYSLFSISVYLCPLSANSIQIAQMAVRDIELGEVFPTCQADLGSGDVDAAAPAVTVSDVLGTGAHRGPIDAVDN